METFIKTSNILDSYSLYNRNSHFAMVLVVQCSHEMMTKFCFMLENSNIYIKYNVEYFHQYLQQISVKSYVGMCCAKLNWCFWVSDYIKYVHKRNEGARGEIWTERNTEG